MTIAHRDRAWPGWLLAALVPKALMILVDPQLRLFLGDSSSYLYAAHADGWLPPDRSFVYPFLIKWLVPPGTSLAALLYWQTLAGIGVAMLLGWLLQRRLGLPRTLVIAAVCLFALEPAQLFYERMVLAETFGLLAFAGFFAAAAAYLARGHVLWLPLLAVLGLAAVSLRMNYLPVVIVVSLALPLLAWMDPCRPREWRALGAHCVVAALCFWSVHGAYQQQVAALFGAPPGYIGHAGFMRMGLVAPLIKPQHFVRAGLPADFAQGLAFDLADPRTRPSQLWSHGGLADAIAQRGLDVDATCRKLADYALRDDPLGLLRLGIGTLGGYFDPHSAGVRLTKDLGRDPMPYPTGVVANVRDTWHYDIADAQRWTPVSRAFAVGADWLVACLFLLLPLSLVNVVVHWRDPRRAQIVLGAAFGVGLVATQVLFSNIASYRYLHALPLFVLVNALPLGVTFYRRWSDGAAVPPARPRDPARRT
jgi:hypothetical protein